MKLDWHGFTETYQREDGTQVLEFRGMWYAAWALPELANFGVANAINP
jgi:hypothetical protein